VETRGSNSRWVGRYGASSDHKNEIPPLHEGVPGEFGLSFFGLLYIYMSGSSNFQEQQYTVCLAQEVKKKFYQPAQNLLNPCIRTHCVLDFLMIIRNHHYFGNHVPVGHPLLS